MFDQELSGIDPKRSALMSRVRGKDTTPELFVRRLVHRLGFRFRLHRRDLPGRPDIVFPGKRKLIFVHGCFWHRHAGCRYATMPKTRAEFWRLKFDQNVKRDAQAIQELDESGWDCLVVWQCELKDEQLLKDRLLSFLG